MIRRTLVILILIAVGSLFMLGKLERQLVFFPSIYPEGHWNPTQFPFEDVWFTTEDGIKLHGWWIPKPDAKANLLYCHGNAGNLTDRIPALEALREHLAVNILIFDYRGYGRSEGKPDGGGILLDGLAAFTTMKERNTELPQWILGRSLGGAVATHVAAESQPDALILENTFSSLPDVAKIHYPWLPARFIMKHPQDSWKKIARYRGPLFQGHGTEDEVVPYDLGKRLHAEANEPKKWFSLAGLGHNDLATPEYFTALKRFVESTE